MASQADDSSINIILCMIFIILLRQLNMKCLAKIPSHIRSEQNFNVF